MQCPLCIDEVLEPRFHGSIEIDVCPKCRGVWLDRGELEKLAEPAPVPTPRRDDEYRDRDDDRDDRRGKGKKKRRKSIGERLGDVLEEVLDFD